MADLRSLEEQKKKTQVEGVQSAMEIAQTVQRGGVPATTDVVKVLESTESALDTQKANVALDEKGKTVLRDTENLIGATKELLEKKNVDEKLQTIVAEARLASESVPRSFGGVGDQVLSDADLRRLEDLKFKMLETAHIGQEVLKLVISSAEFRQILLTLVAISQSVFFEVSEAVKQQPDPQSALQAGAEKVSQTLREGVSEKVPEHLRQELYAEYTSLLRKLAVQPEWRQGVTNVFSLLDRIEVVSDQAAEKAKAAAVEIKLDRHAQEVVQGTKELAEEFLPGTKTLDPLINNVKKLATAVRNDQQMLDFVGRLRNYFERASEDPALVDTEEFKTEAQKLTQEGRALVGAEKYQKSIRGVLDEWREVIAGFTADEELNMFKSALEKLVKDFTIVDATGKRHLDTNAVYQIRQLLIPLIIEQLKFIPIPHLEGSNETYDWTADNIILSGYDVFPDHVKINTSSETDVHIREQTPGWTRGFMLIVIDGIKTKMSDMKFWYKRKSFPRMEDAGIADVDIAGGINVQIRLNVDTEMSTGRLMFTTGSVFVRADDVKVKVREAKHNWIYSMFPGTFANPIKNGMQKYIAEALAQLVVRLKNSLNEAMITVTSVNVSETLEKVKQNIPSLYSGASQQTA